MFNLRVLKENNKSRFDSYNVKNVVLIISHIEYQSDYVIKIEFVKL